MMSKKNKVSESASAGATSAGAIASVSNGLHFPLNKRIPPANFFGYEVWDTKKAKPKDKDGKKED